jgi:hypothetical protein
MALTTARENGAEVAAALIMRVRLRIGRSMQGAE